MRKPTLGHPTRTDAILALRAHGLSTMAIAGRIGATPKQVAALEHTACRSAARRARPAEQQGRTILFPLDVIQGLHEPADRRGIHPNELARRIIEQAIDADLINAILDDGQGAADAS